MTDLCLRLTNVSFRKLKNPQVKPFLIPFVLKNAVQASTGRKTVFQMGIHWYQASA